MSATKNTWPSWPHTDMERDAANIAQRERVRIAMARLRARRKSEGYKVPPVQRLPKAMREIVEKTIGELVTEPSHPRYKPNTGESLTAILRAIRARMLAAGLLDARNDDMPIAARGLGVILRSMGYEVARGTSVDYGPTCQYVRGRWLPANLAPTR